MAARLEMIIQASQRRPNQLCPNDLCPNRQLLTKECRWVVVTIRSMYSEGMPSQANPEIVSYNASVENLTMQQRAIYICIFLQ
jgi:hypothetical protein